MSWWEYVQRIAKTDRQRDISDRTGIDATNITRWKSGTIPGPQFVSAFAKGYERPVLEAFVAAGFLSEADAKARPAAAPDYSQLTDDELLELVRARMQEGSGEHVRSAANTPAGSGRLRAVASGGRATAEEMDAAEARAALSKAQQEIARLEMELKQSRR